MIAILSFLLLPLAAPVGPYAMAIRPSTGETFTAVLTGPAPGPAVGDFGGTITVNGSPAAMPASGKTELSQGRLKLLLTLRWADVPADWVSRYRPEGFDYRVRGRVGGREELDWSGSLRWNEVEVDGGRETASHYLRLGSIELTRFSLLESEARAKVAVRNPFSFPLKVAGADYRLYANGREVGAGDTRGLLLHAARESTLDFPIEIDHGQLLAAAGEALASGGEVGGRLQGRLTVRLPGGDIAVPLDLSGRLELLSR